MNTVYMRPSWMDIRASVPQSPRVADELQTLLRKAQVFAAGVFVRTVVASPLLSKLVPGATPQVIVTKGVSKKYSQLYQAAFIGSLVVTGISAWIGSSAPVDKGVTPAPTAVNSKVMLATPISTGLPASFRFENSPVRPSRVDFGPLAGENMGDNLNAWYVGLNGHAPQSATIDYGATLQSMWDRKLRRSNVTVATRRNAGMIVQRYRSARTYTSLESFVGFVGQQANESYRVIEWDRLCAGMHIDQASQSGGCSLVRDISSRITGRHLVAYGMTELMPRQRDGLFNAQLTDHLLRTAGIEYLNSVPALGDDLASLGFWQFTSFAVRHDADGAQGASLVSRYVPRDYRIPGSVVLLERDDHSRAAYYFSVYNIALLVRYSTENERRNLRALIRRLGGMDQVSQYMAIAHHMPAPARTRTRAWLSRGAQGMLRQHLGRRLTIYADKSFYNLHELDLFLQ